MGTSIIFVHKGKSFYLRYSLKQARKMNPGNPIYLITDSHENVFPGIETVLMDEFSEEALAFEKIYRHMSTNNYLNELFCFQRWFIIRQFLKKKGIPAFVYYDSDVLLFCRADEELPKFSGFEFTVSKKIGPQYTYFSSASSLDRVCAFMTQLYTEPPYLERLLKKHQFHLDNQLPGGVCDMTAFGEYQQEHPGCAKDLSLMEEGAVYDDNINESDGFETSKSGIKKIVLKHGKAIGRKDKRQVFFKALHFQGRGKRHLHRYYTGGGYLLHRLKRELIFHILESFFLVRVFRKLKIHIE